MTLSKRKGARSIKEVPADILQQLNTGQLATANLVEWLAVDQQLLLESLLSENGRMDYLQPLLDKIGQLGKQTVNTVNEAIGTGLFELASTNKDKALFKIMATHNADLIRCWATYMIGKNEALDITKTLEQVQSFAADPHFGVREICWMAVRPKIARHLEESIALLAKWTSNPDGNIRRFASESTRPRGVWCAHIDTLKQKPELALPILEPLKSDPEKYVQDSVGNWLNDAGKTQAEFVQSLCKRWETESNTKATQYIIKKALRSFNK